MGSLVQAIREASGVATGDQIKQRLELMLVAAKAKIRGYRDEINESFMNPAMVDKIEIPGIRAIRFIEQYHVASSSSFSTQVAGHMSAAINSFFSIGGKDQDNKEAVRSGVQSLISGALDAFIGSTEAGESEEKIYVVVPENNAFIRADICVWKYHMSDQSMADNQDTAVAYVLCKSVIDHTKITLDELIYLASETLASRRPLVAKLSHDDAKYKAAEKELAEANKALIEADKLAPDKKDDAKTKANAAIAAATARLDALDLVVVDSLGKPVLRDDGSYIPASTLDANNPTQSSPPSLAQVEAYIEELIRVWTKLKDAR